MNSSPISTLQPIPCSAQQLLQQIQHELANRHFLHIPQHVAIIPDGNRRWAKAGARPFYEGYLQGAFALIRTALVARELHIPVLTVFSFSTENWKRASKEQAVVWELFVTHLQFYQDKLIESGIKITTIGNLNDLPQPLRKTLQEVETATQECSQLTLVLAMNYGGRDELVRTFKKLLELHKQNALVDISEHSIAQHLDTHPWPDPDLIIRTGGEQRLSNFLLWQSSYSELYIEQDFWPNFSTSHFVRALDAFQGRCRRHGGGEA